MRRVRVLAAVVGLCLVGAACDDAGGVVSAPPSFTKASLETFANCDEALDHLKAEALERVTPWGLPGNNWPGGPEIWLEDDFVPVPEVVPAETFQTTTTFRQVAGTIPVVSGRPLPITSGGDDSSDASFSGTNVQVAGVDEPDVVKTNGSTLYVVRGRQLDVVDIRGAEPQPLGSFQLDNWGAQILLEGTRVVVIDSGWDQILQVPSNDIGIRPAPEGSLRTHVTELDVSRPDAIAVTRTASVEGSLVGARLVDGHVRVVVEHTPHDLPFVSPSGRNQSVAQATNRQVIENSTIDDWLPLGTVKIGRQTTTRSAVDCTEIHAPNEFSGFGQAVVFNLDLNDRSATIEASAVLAQASMLYSTATSLYLATNEWVDHSTTRPAVGVTTIPFGPTTPFGPIDETYSTALHAFATPADGTVDYLGSGRVKGHAHNQFSLDEHKGALRVVTTVGAPWSGGSESMVSVLRLLGDELKVMGSVGGLGKGEQVKSVRFAGDRGYVVTFRQIDPLYTLDLTDDRNPRVLGELKIPGFSSYLHPIAGNRLIGVGSDASLDGRVTGLLVSLFDVSNPATPKQVSSVTVSDARSNVSFDHHAFLYWPDTNLLVVPVNSWETNYTGAMGLRVGAASLTEIGLVQHLDPSDRYARPEPIARSLVAQGSLITTSNLGIKVSDLNDMSDRNWLGLPLTSN